MNRCKALQGGSVQCRLQVRVKWLQVQDDEEEEVWWIIAGVSLLGVPLQGVSLHFTLYNLSCIGRETLVLWLQGMG